MNFQILGILTTGVFERSITRPLWKTPSDETWSCGIRKLITFGWLKGIWILILSCGFVDFLIQYNIRSRDFGLSAVDEAATMAVFYHTVTYTLTTKIDDICDRQDWFHGYLFQAGYNTIPGDEKNFNRLMGVLPRDSNTFKLAPIKEFKNDANDFLPENFDSRKKWPECFSLLNSVKDQSNCGSCWVSQSVA